MQGQEVFQVLHFPVQLDLAVGALVQHVAHEVGEAQHGAGQRLRHGVGLGVEVVEGVVEEVGVDLGFEEGQLGLGFFLRQELGGLVFLAPEHLLDFPGHGRQAHDGWAKVHVVDDEGAQGRVRAVVAEAEGGGHQHFLQQVAQTAEYQWRGQQP
ncbi:hypothetical protein BEN49_10915 [Hymenobacter coccineus]|uniref:Uncharacterized protein n=1 Tax=Hymenobacter coccineus TaxID=1908235 RepID=A0A1G1T663_9BACT|nr:hypothetical protein BEN49_10915 [Hymenobacter coccineus]